jgi:tetratricopeptide (TPR) repeat protein
LQIRRAPFFTILMGDSRGYDEWARRIAGGDWLGHDVFYQAPLYPYFLGAIYAVAGRHLLLVRIVQALVGSASCVLLADAGRRFFSRAAGIAAGFMLALYAPAIFFDGLLQKSVLDVFFICLALWLTARIADGARPSSGTWFGLGATLGGLSLTRENALVFVAVAGVWSLVAGRSDMQADKRFDRSRARTGSSNKRSTGSNVRKGPHRTRLRPLALLLTGVASVLVPVAARNSYLGGGFYVTTSQFGPNFYIGNNSRSDGTYQSLRFGRGAPEYERQDATDLAQVALGRTLSPGEVSNYWTDQALEFISSHPGAWLRLIARKAALVGNDTEMVDTEDQATHAEWSWPLRLLGPITRFGVLVPLAVLGFMVSWSTRSRWWILLALAGAYAASVVLFYVFARYRFPLVPFLVLFAAAGLTSAATGLASLARTVAADRTRIPPGRLLRTAAVVAGAAAFANWPLLSPALMRAVTENNLGAALQDEHRYDEAAAHYRRAIEFRADYTPAQNNLASALRAEGRLDEAIATYKRALQLKPDFPDAEYNLANAMLERGATDEAITRLETSLRAIPRSADAHNNLGIALAAKGRSGDAARQFQAALQVDPNSAIAHRNLGDLLASEGDRAAAIEHLRRAVQIDPSDGASHYDLGSVLLEAGAFEEAAKEFRAAVERLPSAEALNNLGIALASQGKLDEAIEQFRRALRLRPGFQDAERNLAMALAGQRAPLRRN